MHLADRLSSAEVNWARSKETAPDSAPQSFTDHLRAIEDDQS
jgi:hypothetical protein